MKAVQVRIAVAVDAEGNWYGVGEPEWNEQDNIGEVTGWVSEPCSVYWLTAELPIPAPQAVEAKVEPAQ